MKKSLAVSLISTIVAILLATPATAAGSQRDELGINSGALVNHVDGKSPVGDSLDQVTWGYGFGRCCVNVRGYYRSNGTYVRPHIRTYPDSNPYNNFSSRRSYWW